MTELEFFQLLKEKVLLKYREQYPFFRGNWKTFGSQEIQNLIDLIETQCKQTISEKWIYTHLKPESNSKIPRKDMLNILSELVGYSGWDEFTFKEKKAVVVTNIAPKNKLTKKVIWLLPSVGIVVVVLFFLLWNKTNKIEPQTIELQNEFTDEKVKSDEVKVFQVSDSSTTELKVNGGKVKVTPATDTKTQLVIQSPFYEPKSVVIDPQKTVATPIQKIDLKPDDFAMMLKAFMVSDIKNWQTRKEQLNQILSDNLEVIVLLKGDLGAEFFNKNEFSQMLVVPSASLKKMKIVEIKNDASNKIQFIRIKQE